MSTAEIFLTQKEIESYLEEYKNDSNYIYGYKGAEFGISPYVSFYIDHSNSMMDIEGVLNHIIDIYVDFEKNYMNKPFNLRYRSDRGVWKKADKWEKTKIELIDLMHKSFKKYFVYFIGATTADTNNQKAQWAFQANIQEHDTRYSFVKICFALEWYQKNINNWHSFVQKVLKKLNPIQAYSGYEIGNTPSFNIVSPEFETAERIFTDYFYGLDIDHPNMNISHHNEYVLEDRDVLGGGIRTPTWCFLLSPYWLEKLGLSEQQIREKLNDPRIEITKIENSENLNQYSLWIRLGELSLYPVEEGVPDLLVIANELIKPIRCDNLKLTTLDAWSDDPNPRFDAVSSKQWIARFDEDSTWPELKRVEVEVQEPERIDIVIAGSPCPHAGYWYTFAKENSRQFFKQGDIFPDFESDWGEVYWQFDGEE